MASPPIGSSDSLMLSVAVPPTESQIISIRRSGDLADMTSIAFSCLRKTSSMLAPWRLRTREQSTPREVQYVWSTRSSVSVMMTSPPLSWTSAAICAHRVVLPDPGSPESSTCLPNGISGQGIKRPPAITLSTTMLRVDTQCSMLESASGESRRMAEEAPNAFSISP